MIIKIFAGKSEGKTTMATWLAGELRRLGIQVECEDQEPLSEAQLAERIQLMGNPVDGLKVTIKTISYGGESRPGYARAHDEKTKA